MSAARGNYATAAVSAEQQQGARAASSSCDRVEPVTAGGAARGTSPSRSPGRGRDASSKAISSLERCLGARRSLPAYAMGAHTSTGAAQHTENRARSRSMNNSSSSGGASSAGATASSSRALSGLVQRTQSYEPPPGSPSSSGLHHLGLQPAAQTSRNARWRPLRAGALTERDSKVDEQRIRADEALAWQRELKHLEERLASVERERDWAMTALRGSESELQALMTQSQQQPQPQQSTEIQEIKPEQDDVRLNHYRVLVELLTVRCRLLEQWLEEEAAMASTACEHEEQQAQSIREMDSQVRQLGEKVLEQQRSFQAQAAEMAAHQEALEEQHQGDLAQWSQELLREREEASRGFVDLQEDFRRREDLWVQEWAKAQVEMQQQSVELHGPPSHLFLCRTEPSFARRRSQREDDQTQAAGCTGQATAAGSLSPEGDEEHAGLGWPPPSDAWEGGGPAGGPGIPLEPIPEVATEEGEETDWSPTCRKADDAGHVDEPEEVALGSSSPSRTPPPRAPQEAPERPAWAEAAVAPASTPDPDYMYQDCGDTGGGSQSQRGEQTEAGGSLRCWTTTPATLTVPGMLAAGLPRVDSAQDVDQSPEKPGEKVRKVGPSPTVRAPPSSCKSCSSSSSSSTPGPGLQHSQQQFAPVPEELLRSLERAKGGEQASRAWARIGQFQQRQKNFAEARGAYENSVLLDGSKHGCLANLAQLEAHAGNLAAAQGLIASALQLDPGNKAYESFGRWLAAGGALPRTPPARPTAAAAGGGAGSSGSVLPPFSGGSGGSDT